MKKDFLLIAREKFAQFCLISSILGGGGQNFEKSLLHTFFGFGPPETYFMSCPRKMHHFVAKWYEKSKKNHNISVNIKGLWAEALAKAAGFRIYFLPLVTDEQSPEFPVKVPY